MNFQGRVSAVFFIKTVERYQNEDSAACLPTMFKPFITQTRRNSLHPTIFKASMFHSIGISSCIRTAQLQSKLRAHRYVKFPEAELFPT